MLLWTTRSPRGLAARCPQPFASQPDSVAGSLEGTHWCWWLHSWGDCGTACSHGEGLRGLLSWPQLSAMLPTSHPEGTPQNVGFTQPQKLSFPNPPLDSELSLPSGHRPHMEQNQDGSWSVQEPLATLPESNGHSRLVPAVWHLL